MQTLIVAIVQSVQFWEDKKSNLTHFEHKIIQTIPAGSCDLILLPEMFNTGFSMNTDSLAETEDGLSVVWMIKMAQKLNCEIGATLIIKDQKNVYNRFLIVSKYGISARYDKRHLFRMAGENEHFTCGKDKVIYHLNGWNILLQVCYDLRFPVFSRNKVINGTPEYDCVIYLANWPSKRADVWSVLLQARAIENQVFCIGVNRVGEDGKNIQYSGDSALINPWGKIEYLATKNEEQVKILTLDPAILQEVRSLFPAFKDAD